ncbi:hypothetical protein SDC9_163629 [bioreactor metagenome]|uniref:Uncharacterized protein n=1 Tax=bioreactor metagenome TaxID=1076179 RepID=A0A645FPE1_9ZZZZ
MRLLVIPRRHFPTNDFKGRVARFDARFVCGVVPFLDRGKELVRIQLVLFIILHIAGFGKLIENRKISVCRAEHAQLFTRSGLARGFEQGASVLPIQEHITFRHLLNGDAAKRGVGRAVDNIELGLFVSAESTKANQHKTDG